MTPTVTPQATGYDSVAFMAADTFNTFTAGSTLRYKFSGSLVTMSAGATFGIALTHFYGVRSFFDITFASATNSRFINGEIQLFMLSVGNNRNPSLTGYVNYSDGAVVKYLTVQISSWLPNLFDTTVNNAMTVATVVTGTSTQHVINNFTIEQLR